MLQIVDQLGKTIGATEKMAAHERGGTLHRAVSVILIDNEGRMLIQRRASTKYHFAGKWANACCTHPLMWESLEEAGQRALREELGIDTSLREVTQFVYRAYDPESGYTEYEFDHILFGYWNAKLSPNSQEVSEVEWLTPGELLERLQRSPNDFVYWFHRILEELLKMGAFSTAMPPALCDFVLRLSNHSNTVARV